MIRQHNKLIIAGDFLVEAHREFCAATDDTNYARCILLAGAVIGIISPLLEEKGVKPQQVQLAEAAARLSGLNWESLSQNERDQYIAKGLRFYRYVSNALKHAGERNKIAPSADLLFDADLQDEAKYLISTAIDDFHKLGWPPEILKDEKTDKLLDVLQSAFPQNLTR